LLQKLAALFILALDEFATVSLTLVPIGDLWTIPWMDTFGRMNFTMESGNPHQRAKELAM
jgi:hypothetical protein